MGVIERMRTSLQKWIGGGGVSRTGIPISYPWTWWQQNLPRMGTAGQTAIVHACVDAYGQTIASVPAYHWRYSEDDSRTKVRTTAASRVMRKPNGYQTRSDLMYNLVKALLLDGNAYLYATRNNREEVDAIHQLPPRSTQPYVGEDGEVFYAAGDNPMIGRIDYMIPARDICHLRLYCPRHPLIGVSPIENAASSIAANSQITQHQATFFENMSRPSGLLTTDQPLTAGQMKQLRSAWEEHSTRMNAGHVPILANGMKWQTMSLTSQDAQLVDAFNMTVEDVARAFRVPLPLVNDTRHSTYNNVEQLIASWLSGGLGFLLDHVENALDALFQLPPADRIEFDIDVLLRTDFAGRVDGYTKGIQMGLFTHNEARARFGGLQPVDHGDKPMVQQQMVPLGWAEEQPEPEPEPEPDPALEPLDEEQELSASVHYLKGLLNG